MNHFKVGIWISKSMNGVHINPEWWQCPVSQAHFSRHQSIGSLWAGELREVGLCQLAACLPWKSCDLTFGQHRSSHRQPLKTKKHALPRKSQLKTHRPDQWAMLPSDVWAHIILSDIKLRNEPQPNAHPHIHKQHTHTHSTHLWLKRAKTIYTHTFVALYGRKKNNNKKKCISRTLCWLSCTTLWRLISAMHFLFFFTRLQLYIIYFKCSIY